MVGRRYFVPFLLFACARDPGPPPSAPIAVDVSPAPPTSSGPLAQSPPPNPDRFHEPPPPSSTVDPPDESRPSIGGGTAPFNRTAAAAAFGGARVQMCAVPGGPTGMGHVVVTFEPSGRVAAVTIDQPPFAGTVTGGCLARLYGTLTVPPFSGGPVRIGKTFTLP